MQTILLQLYWRLNLCGSYIGEGKLFQEISWIIRTVTVLYSDYNLSLLFLCYVEACDEFLCYIEVCDEFFCYAEACDEFLCYVEVCNEFFCYAEVCDEFLCYVKACDELAGPISSSQLLV